jgi:tRNA(fMet)-specific endonuclease VapC
MEKMVTNKIIVDTDILVDLLRNKKEAVDLISKFEFNRTLLSTTTISAFELCYGAHKSKQRIQTLKATVNLLDRLVILPLTSRSAQRAGYLYADQELKGQPIGLRDTFIAAIALTRKMPLATRNLEHFRKVKDLSIITA